jgi:Flp pilus assembly protein TadD
MRAAELDRAWALPANGVGLALNERRDFPGARAYLEEAVRRDPEWAIPYNSIGTSYLLEENLDDAERNYRKAAELLPTWPRPRAWLGDIAARRGDHAAAAVEYQAALDLDTADPPSLDRARLQLKLDAALKRAGGSKPIAP